MAKVSNLKSEREKEKLKEEKPNMKKKYGDGDGFDEYEGDAGGWKKKKKMKLEEEDEDEDEEDDYCKEEEDEDYCSYFDEEYTKRMESERPSDVAGYEEWEKFLKKWYISGASTRNLDLVDEEEEDCKRKQKQKEEEYHEEDEEYCNQLDKQLYCGRKDPIDVADATPLFVRLSHLRRLGLNLGDFRQFVSECHCRKSFKIYDLPGDPRPGGFCHWYGDSISDQDTQPAKFALDEYRTRCNNASPLQLVKVEKISCFPDCDPWYYHTFTARDENTGEVKTYQAQVLEYGEDDQFILGLLRVKDPEKDHVLAVIELEEDEEGHSDADLVDSHEK